MKAEQIRLLRQTWRDVKPRSGEVSASFYRKLFELDPSTRLLFEQKDGTVALIDNLIENFDRLDKLIPLMQSMGRHHSRRGLAQRHFYPIAIALLWSLEEELGGRFTPEVREAWALAYGLVADTMKSAIAAERLAA